MGAATIVSVEPGVEDLAGPGSPRQAQRALAARRADADRARRRGRGRRPAPSLFVGDGHVQLVPRFELAGEELVAHDDLASLRRSPSAAPGRTARPAGPAALRPATVSAIAVSVERPTTARAPRPTAATYRRRQAVAVALVLGALLAGAWALGVLGGGPLTASEAGSKGTVSITRAVPVSRTTYVVQPGDTLWSIAHAAIAHAAIANGDTAGTDVRPIVDALAAERHGRPLEVGETIVLP